MEIICKLQTKKAIETIKDTEKVYYRSGVWNSYEMQDTKTVIKAIENSGYGADVFYNKDNKMYYVSKPCDSDMW